MAEFKADKSASDLLVSILEPACDPAFGHRIGHAEREALARCFGQAVPEWYLSVLERVPLCGQVFESGPNCVEWLVAKDSVDEAESAYPGMILRPLGWVPVGGCMFGSGDPYFVHFTSPDPPLWQVAHDAVDMRSHAVLEWGFLRVADSLTAFFRGATPRYRRAPPVA